MSYGDRGQLPQAEARAARNDNRRYFMFEEICVVVTYETLADRETFPDSVGTRLDRLVRESKRLQPILRQYPIDPAQPLFQPLLRRDKRREFILPRIGDNPGRALLFFRVAMDGRRLDDLQRTRFLGDLVLSMRGVVDGQTQGKDDKNAWTFVAVTPNWLASAVSDGDSGSPAAPPLPAPDPAHTPAKWTFQFLPDEGATDQQRAIQERVTVARGKETRATSVVAVIDTCPTRAEVQEALGRYGGNLLLKELTAGTAGGPVDLRPNLHSAPDEVVPDWEGWLKLWLDPDPGIDKVALRKNFYRMTSHGIFSAGIIRDIAPNVPIHLLGALNGPGMSTLDTLADTFTMLPGLISPGQSLIVNCSWTTSTMAQNNLAPSLRGFGALADGFFQHALSHLIQWLDEQEGKQILVVAAAGNNALDDPPLKKRPLADYPAGLAAAHDNLLSVSATAATAVDRAAAYSNDRRASSDRAIATIGGDAVMVAQQTHLKEVAPGEYDAIKGVFTQRTFPIGNGTAPFIGAQNTTGWAHWAGTSFATPIVSALAAILWDGCPGVPASQVAGEVLGLATVTSVAGFTNIDAIYARQTP